MCVCVCVCVCTVTDFSAQDKAGGVNFARGVIGVQGKKSRILGNFAPLEAQNRLANRASARTEL